MEQGHRLDSTPVSAAQIVRGGSTDEPALDAAVAGLLTSPTKAAQAQISDLASACLEQVERLNRWDANPGSLSDEEGNDEMSRWGSVFQRAINEPSVGLRDLAAKAHLMLADLDRFHPEEDHRSDDDLLMRVILREAIAMGDPATAESGSLVGAYGTTTPALAALVEEWCRLENEMNSREMEDEELDPISARANALHTLICTFESRSIADVQAKVPVYLYERRDLGTSPTQAPRMVARAWDSVVRDIEALGGMRVTAEQTSTDPIFAVIEEGRRLLRATEAVFAIPVPDGTNTPKWLQDAMDGSSNALHAYCDEAVLTTVPLTAPGCRELARFAGEYFASNELPISDDEQAIVRLIAASPLLQGPSPTHPAATTTVLSPNIVVEAQDPAVLREIASEGLALADAIVKYFGDGPINEILDIDLALRNRGLRIRALADQATVS